VMLQVSLVLPFASANRESRNQRLGLPIARARFEDPSRIRGKRDSVARSRKSELVRPFSPNFEIQVSSRADERTVSSPFFLTFVFLVSAPPRLPLFRLLGGGMRRDAFISDEFMPLFVRSPFPFGEATLLHARSLGPPTASNIRASFLYARLSLFIRVP